jgi:putative ABC transport system substrate-binding protein
VKRRDAVASICLAAILPATAAAQQAGRAYRVGFLGQKAATWLVDPLVTALRERGLVVERNLRLEARFPDPDQASIDALAKELVEQRVDLIVAVGTHMALAARRATSTIPIVMYLSGYPVPALAASFARPGGNVTGLSTYGGSEVLFTKFMSLAVELLPSLRELGVLWDYVAPLFLEKEVEQGVGELTRAARAHRVNSHVWMVHKQGDFDDAVAGLSKAPLQALFATSGGFISQPRNMATLNEVAVRRRLPIICDIAGSTFRGVGVLAYSVSWKEAAERCASYVDRILKGAKPAELPIEQPRNFELIIHAGRAKAIGLAIPPAMLIRADKVIE